MGTTWTVDLVLKVLAPYHRRGLACEFKELQRLYALEIVWNVAWGFTVDVALGGICSFQYRTKAVFDDQVVASGFEYVQRLW